MQPSGVHRWCLLVCQMWLLAVAGGAGMEMQATWSSPDCIRIRQATLADVPHLQRINLVCLPENYNQQNFWFHILRWPTLIRVAEARVLRRNSSERGAADAGEDDAEWAVVAYVMAKIDDADDIDGRSQGSPASAHTARAVSSARQEVKGHITSLAVMRSHRRLGLAKRLMQASLEHMTKDFNASTCALHVRAGNRAALGLYRQGLGFLVAKTEQRYYGDGEDALCMQTTLGSA